MRRSEFLGVLAALPVVGGLFKAYKPAPITPKEHSTFFAAATRVMKASYEKSWIDPKTGNFNHSTTFTFPTTGWRQEYVSKMYEMIDEAKANA